MADQWKPIDTAPRDKRIIAKFWHGAYQFVVEAEARGDGGWQDIREDSCIGWLPESRWSKPKPAYWLCEVSREPAL